MKHLSRAERRVYVRTVRHDPPDVDLLSKAFLTLTLADAKEAADVARDTSGVSAPPAGGVSSNGTFTSNVVAETDSQEVDHDA
ncbi:hypothetical protein CJ179_39190 [Rhodococcus sp. ACS1]|nr:hypothetical protein CJ179_39190 [Rhodococcus sp. ACS1]